MMHRLIILLLILILAIPVLADTLFRVESLCASETDYRLFIHLDSALYGLQIIPSHDPAIEIFASGNVQVSKNNEWVELRPISSEPAMLEMLHFDTVNVCTGNEPQVPLTDADMVLEVLSLSTVQEWLGDE
jgi:hypothetical protein